jgi:hypothetical protein
MSSRVSAGKPSLIQLSANVSYNQDILSDLTFGVGNRLHGALRMKKLEWKKGSRQH